MRTVLRINMLLAVLVALGCGAKPPQAGKPPIEFSFRKSQIPMRGMVVGIRNASAEETLTNFIVKVHAPNEQGTRSHRVDAPVEPEDTITVGWVELDGWKLKPKDRVTVTCEQYTDEVTVEVPEP